jgi:hypothetical protein
VQRPALMADQRPRRLNLRRGIRDHHAGCFHSYLLLWVVLAANLMAMVDVLLLCQ